ncbi:DNA cytosine methyltransferase [Paraburkholderia youngii]|uniref:DNA cytosine methyltransferase n=1 Tax=Paraburkholderia youngii TaxID=2782701 RepID=UPI003D1CC515
MSKPLMNRGQFILPFRRPKIGDLFAGGGGMSEAIRIALGRDPDFAVNHNPDALSMHEANHPQTKHMIADVREVDPRLATEGEHLGYLHLSPDCCHHSQAKAGQPREHKIRALAWVAVHWCGTVRPDVMTLENVVQLLKWGRLIAKRDKATGRVVRLDGTIAQVGERVPREQQFLVPDPKHAGKTFERFVGILRGLGYQVEWKADLACNKGAPQARERLLIIARCDGKPIVWPEDTHAKIPEKGQKKWRAAAECIDFSLPSKSIFGRKKDLAPATLRRIAAGIERFVMKSSNPFIVPLPEDSARANQSFNAATIASHAAGAQGAPVLIQMGYGERKGQAPRALDITQPLGTVVAGGGKHAVATAYLAQMNGGFNDLRGVPGRDLRQPFSTLTQKGSQQQLVSAHLLHLRNNCDARSLNEPLATVSAQGQHHALIECLLSQEQRGGAMRVAQFLKSQGIEGVTGLEPVMVMIDGYCYAIVDITLRMLVPRELFSAFGFPEDYIIDRGHDGRVFSATKQIRMAGNSVSPVWGAAFVRANLPHLILPGTHAPGARSRTGRGYSGRMAA